MTFLQRFEKKQQIFMGTLKKPRQKNKPKKTDKPFMTNFGYKHLHIHITGHNSLHVSIQSASDTRHRNLVLYPCDYL